MGVCLTKNEEKKQTNPPIENVPIDFKPSFLETTYKKHLVVDDSEYNRDILTTYLLRKGIGSISAKNGKEAVDKYKDCDIIWIDVRMPIMDGIEATKRIRELGFKGPIIGLTGAVEIKMMKLYVECGMTLVINKPIEKENIYQLVDKYYI